MSEKSSIEWTESTWNPVTGCTKKSLGCVNCYAERLAVRLQAMSNKKYKNGFSITLHPDTLQEPLKWKGHKIIFVCSMSDLFHEKIEDEYILKVFDVMNNTSRHIFQVLTKRSERLLKLADKIKWTNNIWMGVTVESQEYIYRIDNLANISAHTKFLSLEPLLSSIPNLPLNNIDWVIVGGESGIKARPIKQEWVQDIRDKCISENVQFFFKQWGGINRKKTGSTLDGQLWKQMPEIKPKEYKTPAFSFTGI